MPTDENTEDKLVKELGIRIQNTKVDEFELRRFLRARNHDIDKAEQMLQKSLEWRKEVQLDMASSWTISKHIVKSFPYFVDGRDKEGRMVMYFPVGRWEVRKFLNEGHRCEMDKYMYQTMAAIGNAILESKGEQFNIIIDLAELTYWKIAHYETMQMVLAVFRDYEQNFPETLHSAIVINAPWVLNCIFPLVKPLLTGHTLQKVQIFDSCPEKYFPAILDVVPIKGLPSGFHEYNQEMIKARACVQA